MRKLIFAVVVAVLPLTGFAQQVKETPTVRQASSMFGITPDQVLVVGAGTLGGAIGLYALLGGASWSLAGGAAGAMIGDWWYMQRYSTINARRGTGATLAGTV